MMASGSEGYSNNLKVWDIDQGEEIMNLKGHDHDVNTVSISLDKNYLASGSADSTIRLWNLRTGKEI